MLANPWMILAAVLAIGSAGAGGYWRGHSDATTACSAETYRTLAEARGKALIAAQARLATVNEAAANDARRALENARRLAELQEAIDAIPDNADACLPAESSGRLRSIR
jgi:hypothetical protein